jgi:MoxR-like ATPase
MSSIAITNGSSEQKASTVSLGGGSVGKWIVVEGLDGVGKTTITKELSSTLNAELLRTPPTELAFLRPHFDKQVSNLRVIISLSPLTVISGVVSLQPAPVRRAFYALGNQVAGHAAQVRPAASSLPNDMMTMTMS